MNDWDGFLHTRLKVLQSINQLLVNTPVQRSPRSLKEGIIEKGQSDPSDQRTRFVSRPKPSTTKMGSMGSYNCAVIPLTVLEKVKPEDAATIKTAKQVLPR